MKKLHLFLLFVLVGASQMVSAQISFKTGDATLEAELNVINNDAKKDLKAFKSDVSVEFSISQDKVQSFLNKAMEPAEIILSARIANIAGASIDDVVKTYEANKDKGWGYIAKEMGIKPGSPEFHALKGKSKAKGNSNAKGKGKKK